MRAAGTEALERIDHALAQRPHKDNHALAAATEALAAFREDLLRARGEAGATPREKERLAHVNAILSVVMGMHFPLGNPPWDELVKARDWLSGVLETP